MIDYPPSQHAPASLSAYGRSAAVCVLAAVAAELLRPLLDLPNTVMLFLLAVFLVATRLGRGPAVMAAFLSVGMFDFFFVPPQLTFAVADAQYLVTFVVMLAVGLVTAHLASRLAEKKEQAEHSEEQARGLYEVAREVAGALAVEQVVQAASAFLARRGLDAHLLLSKDDDLEFPGRLGDVLDGIARNLARTAYRQDRVVEADSLAGFGVAAAFFPMRAPTRLRGVLAVAPRGADAQPLHDQRGAIEAIASLSALALERLHYAQAAQRAELQVAEERLRTSVLSSLSHDLRTPLTTLVGLADSLAQESRGLSAEVIETTLIIRDQAGAMHRLLSDLLDMARLQGEGTALRREWQPFDEVVGSALRLVEGTTSRCQVNVQLPADLPLLYFDAPLLERVLCNLLDNAYKYSRRGTVVELRASLLERTLEVTVCNEGAGFPPDRLSRVFELFMRGHDEPSIPGVGLGLAICKAIVEAHGGSIVARNQPGGACVCFTLPRGTPPMVEEES